MNSSDPLASLRDIHLPEPISWWPLAPGWWILMALLLLILIWLGVHLRKRFKWHKVQNQTLSSLDEIDAAYRQSKDQQRLLRDYSQLLRRLLLWRAVRHEVASITGEQWRKLLQTQLPANLNQTQYLDNLIQGPYQAQTQIQDLEGFQNWMHDCTRFLARKAVREEHHD